MSDFKYPYRNDEGPWCACCGRAIRNDEDDWFGEYCPECEEEVPEDDGQDAEDRFGPDELRAEHCKEEARDDLIRRERDVEIKLDFSGDFEANEVADFTPQQPESEEFKLAKEITRAYVALLKMTRGE